MVLPIPPSQDAIRTDLKIAGRIVSRGKAIGTAVILEPQDRRISRLRIENSRIDHELARLRSAVKTASDQLGELVDNSLGHESDSAHGIFDAQLLILSESSLVFKIEQQIQNELINAEWAAKLIADEYLDQFRSLKDEILRERLLDVQDVFERIYDALAHESRSISFAPNSIVVASDLRPSNILDIAKFQPAAIVVESGGWTSHTFIMARELGIPAISGIRNAVRRINAGSLIAVDAVAGFIVIDPSDDLQAQFLLDTTASRDEPVGTPINGIVLTTDGVGITIAANVDSVAACHFAMQMGSSEVGLLRSEYLFDVTRRLPDEALQIERYRELVEQVGEQILNIRTFDLGVGQLASARGARERNPALGLRSIRLSLRFERQFRVQLRSLIKANTSGNIQIVIPLVSGVRDIQRTRAILVDEYQKLIDAGQPATMPLLGPMIELPSAVLTIEDILDHSDFVCMGTNDLVQYLVGVDRDNETVAGWYETLHPSVLRSIKIVVEAADRAGKPVTVCGEIAGSAFYAPLLIGLGVRKLSMSPVSLVSVSNQIRLFDSREAQDLATSVLKLSTAEVVENELLRFNSSIASAKTTRP